MDYNMQIVAVCQEFKWTYFDYVNQPQWFTELARQKLVIDAKEAELQQKKHNGK